MIGYSPYNQVESQQYQYIDDNPQWLSGPDQRDMYDRRDGMNHRVAGTGAGGRGGGSERQDSRAAQQHLNFDGESDGEYFQRNRLVAAGAGADTSAGGPHSGPAAAAGGGGGAAIRRSREEWSVYEDVPSAVRAPGEQRVAHLKEQREKEKEKELAEKERQVSASDSCLNPINV